MKYVADKKDEEKDIYKVMVGDSQRAKWVIWCRMQLESASCLPPRMRYNNHLILTCEFLRFFVFSRLLCRFGTRKQNMLKLPSKLMLRLHRLIDSLKLGIELTHQAADRHCE